MAIINQHNEELRQQNRVKEFFATVKNIKSVWDKDTREWLCILPYTICGEVILLFESNINRIFKNYQLHPSYSWLTQDVNVKDLDIKFHQLLKTKLWAS